MRTITITSCGYIFRYSSKGLLTKIPSLDFKHALSRRFIALYGTMPATAELPPAARPAGRRLSWLSNVGSDLGDGFQDAKSKVKSTVSAGLTVADTTAQDIGKMISTDSERARICGNFCGPGWCAGEFIDEDRCNAFSVAPAGCG